MHNRWRYSSVVVVFVFILTALLVRGSGEVRHASLTSPILDALTAGEVASAFQNATTPEFVQQPRAAILPHHLTARALVAELILSLKAKSPHTIVVVGPDHANTSPAFVTTSQTDWVWEGTRFQMNRRIVDELVVSDFVQASDAVIAKEHSVLMPLPFLAHQFPDAEYVLLTVRAGFDRTAMQRIAEQLHTLLQPDDLVVASVDFSHYTTLANAEQEDAESQALLEAGNPDALSAIHADSPEALAIAMRYARYRGSKTFSIVRHSNSAELLGALDAQNTTSYFTAVWE